MTLEKPPSGAEVLQQWKEPLRMKRPVLTAIELRRRLDCALEQIEEDRAALISLRQELWAFRSYYIGDHRLGLDPEANPEVARATKACAAADEALTLSKLEAR